MWKFLVLLVMVYMITYDKIGRQTQAKINGYQTQYFDISNGKSLGVFKLLESQGVSDETLMKFATMEDKFLEFEKNAVCNDSPNKYQALQLSQQIKETFPAYDFTYHDIHIKQISEPNKLINRHLKCFQH